MKMVKIKLTPAVANLTRVPIKFLRSLEKRSGCSPDDIVQRDKNATLHASLLSAQIVQQGGDVSIVAIQNTHKSCAHLTGEPD